MKRVVAVKHDRVLFAEENDHDSTKKFLTWEESKGRRTDEGALIALFKNDRALPLASLYIFGNCSCLAILVPICLTLFLFLFQFHPRSDKRMLTQYDWAVKWNAVASNLFYVDMEVLPNSTSFFLHCWPLQNVK